MMIHFVFNTLPSLKLITSFTKLCYFLTLFGVSGQRVQNRRMGLHLNIFQYFYSFGNNLERIKDFGDHVSNLDKCQECHSFSLLKVSVLVNVKYVAQDSFQVSNFWQIQPSLLINMKNANLSVCQSLKMFREYVKVVAFNQFEVSHSSYEIN